MLRSTLAAAVLVASTFGAQAVTVFTATVTNNQEAPPVVPTLVGGAPRPASFGTAVFELNDAMTSLTFEAMVNNIDVTGLQSADPNDNLVSAHIHAAPGAVPGVNAPVVWGFFGTPFNDTNPTDTVFTPFASGVGGVVQGKWDLPEGNAATNLTLQLPNLMAGHAYINFHTTQFPGGEIRGQILPIPEPETYALMLTGLGVVIVVARRRRENSRAFNGQRA